MSTEKKKQSNRSIKIHKAQYSSPSIKPTASRYDTLLRQATMTFKPSLSKYQIQENPYQLDKIKLPEAHIVNGKEFPVAYQLNLNGKDHEDEKVHHLLTEFSKSGTFTKLFEDHGAVVLRALIPNSDDTKGEQITKVINIIESNRDLVPFQQTGTIVTRKNVGVNLYTASKSNAEYRLLQHNEYSRFKRYPKSIIFTIFDYTARGGETPLVHGAEFYQEGIKEQQDFVKKLSKLGLLFNEEVWPLKPTTKNGITWGAEVAFGKDIKAGDDLQTQKTKAEKVAKEYISDNFKWSETDDLVVTSLAKPVKKYKGQPLIFSSIPGFSDRYVPDNPNMRFGNGELFDQDELNQFVEINKRLEYLHHWKSGDIVFVNNYQVSHGKRPYFDGKRDTQVGMWDDKVKIPGEFVDYVIDE